MPKMRVDLAGLLLNAAAQIENPQRSQREYYAFALREAAKHAQLVQADAALAPEFLDLYSLVEVEVEG